MTMCVAKLKALAKLMFSYLHDMHLRLKSLAKESISPDHLPLFAAGENSFSEPTEA